MFPPVSPRSYRLLMRQRQLLDDERTVRVFSSLAAATLSAFFVPPLLVAVCFLVLILCEIAHANEFARLELMPQNRRTLPALILIAVVGDTAFIIPAVMMWFTGETFPQFASILMLVGGLMNVTMVRAIYLPLGFANALPLVVAMIGVQVVTFAHLGWTEMIAAFLFASVFLNYFLTALLSNHRLQKELYLARDTAVARSESQTRFVANMSHELRTPLNAILGLSRAMTERAPTPELELILSKSRHMSLLVEDMLDLSAIEVGVLKVDPAPCDIHHAFGEIYREWQKTAAEKGLSFVLRIAPDVPQIVLVDIARLRQCINNLLSNAIRFTSFGTVSLHLEQHLAGLELSVLDTGQGLPIGAEERLFHPYQQFSESSALRHGGSGLGLAISHGLARTMQGDLRLDRSHTRGACFRMCFAAPPAQMPPKPALADKNSLLGKSVLVVDDVATNRLVIRLLLEPLGVKVTEAASGEAVLNNKDLAQVDLVLLDIHMPGLSGHDTLGHMRASGLVAPIVALSADAHFTQREAAFRIGFADYLTKPIELEALVETIQKVMRP